MRLTVRDKDGLVRSAIDCPHGCQYVSCSLVDGMTCQHQCEADVMCKLADYEDAEEQGLLLRLPVAEGATVYVIDFIYECKYEFECPLPCDRYKCEEEMHCENQYKRYVVREARFNYMMLAKIGKTVFLTKEEAEAALAEKGGAE